MKFRSRKARMTAAVAAILSGGALAQATNLTWDSDPVTPGVQDAGGLWDTATANWYDGTNNVTWNNATPDSAILGADTNTFDPLATPNNVDLSEPLVAQDITLSVGANGGAYNITDFFGGSLTVNGNITKSAAAGVMQIQLISAPLTLSAGNHNFIVNDTGGDNAPELTINGEIGGSGDVTLDNGSYVSWGSLAFNVNNSYTGTTNISKGRLIITQPQALGSTSAGTTISNMGALSIGGANTTVSAMNIAEPITITRNTYTGTDFENYPAAFIVNNNGAAATHTLSGQLTVDSTDARIAAMTNTLIISSDIIEGPTVTPGTGQLTLTGDFAGFVTLTGNNTAIGTTGIKIMGGVEVNVSNDNNLGGPTAPITFLGDGTLHPVGGWMTSFGTHPVNATTFSGGLDVDNGQTFTIDIPLGDTVNAVGHLGMRGTGTLNLNSTINLRGGSTYFDGGTVNVNSDVTLQSLHLRSPQVNINSGAVVTLTTENSIFGESSNGTNGGPDKAILDINGTGKLISNWGGEFRISNEENTEGTINLKDSGELSHAGLMFVGRDGGGIGGEGTINQTGGTMNLTRTGNFTLVLGSRNGTGTYEFSGGTANIAGEFYVGQAPAGVGVFNMSGGTLNLSNWFVVAREGGTSKGTVDISGGTFTQTGGNFAVGESNQDNQLTIRNNAIVSTTGEFWVGNGGGNKGTLNVQDTATVSLNSWFVVGRFGAEGTLNLSGGSITKAGPGDRHTEFDVDGGGTSTVTVSGTGVMNINSGELRVGQNGGADATLNLQGNGAINTNFWTVIGRGGGTGKLNMSGGTFTKTGGGNFIVAAGGGSNGTFTQTGGTFTNTGSQTWINEGATNAVWTISGSAVANVGAVRIVEAGGGSGTINLNGGTLTANSVTGGGGGTKTFNFNGGTLRAGASSGTFMQGLTTANVQNGGAIIDTNGNNITIAQQLASAGTGGLTKNGVGTLSMTNVRLPSLTVSAGTWKATPQADPYVVGSEAGTSKVATLTASSGVVDLSNTKIITQDASMVATPVYDGVNDTYIYDGVHGLVQTGRGDGTWNGTSGITTSQTDATTGQFTSLAVGTGAELRGLGPTDTELFAGQTINGNSTIVMYTYGGDADMDGDLDGDDYFAIDSNVLQSEVVFGWNKGDFDYNGRINGDDYFILDSNILQAQSSGNVFWVRPPEFSGGGSGAAGLTAVPEPASIGLIGLAAARAMRRRRRVK